MLEYPEPWCNYNVTNPKNSYKDCGQGRYWFSPIYLLHQQQQQQGTARVTRVNCFIRLHLVLMFHRKGDAMLGVALVTKTWLTNNKYDQTASDDRFVGVREFRVATLNGKLKFPSHTNKTFSFKIQTVWILRYTPVEMKQKIMLFFVTFVENIITYWNPKSYYKDLKTLAN
jgi:hypothetical protein